MPTGDPATTDGGVPLRALVFDGDAEYVDILVDVLSFVGDGPETWATTSAAEARRRVARESYDLILVARESGGERLLRDLLRHQPDAVIVVTSASVLTARETTAQFAAGADEVVEKPFHPSVLVARINRLVQVRAQLRDSGRVATSESLVPA